jgi:hypothetical protein
VTLTSLTGALAVSIMCDCAFDGNRSFVWSWTSGWRSLRSVRRVELWWLEIQCAKRAVDPSVAKAGLQGTAAKSVKVVRYHQHNNHVRAKMQ